MTHRFILPVGALAAFASFALITGCSSDATSPNEAANVRVVNASPSTGPITASSENKTVQAGVSFQTPTAAGGCGTIERGGDEQIDFVLAGTQTGLASIKSNFVAQQNYTAVFFGPNNVGVLQESFTAPSANNNAIRFINATGTAGDIYLTIPNAILPGTQPTISNLAAGAASGTNGNAPGGTFAQYPNSNVQVRMFNVGQNTGTPRVDFIIGGLSKSVGTVILTAPPAGQSSPTAFVVGPCHS